MWSRSASSSASAHESESETGSVRVVKRHTQDRQKLVTISDNRGNKSESIDENNSYNDASLSRRQPWRSRYPTPHDLKEQLARSTDGTQDI